VVVGKRTKSNTKKLVKDYAQRTNYRIPKLITSDEYKPYAEAILETYGTTEEEVKGVKKRGRKPKPKKKITVSLLYAIVKKHRRKGVVKNIEIKLRYGKKEHLTEVLEESKVSKHVNTSFIERYNGIDRQMCSRKRRLSNTFSKELKYHKAATWFIITYYNFCRYHSGLRKEIPPEARTEGKKKYIYRTPAMAAGIMTHKFSIWELVNLN